MKFLFKTTFLFLIFQISYSQNWNPPKFLVSNWNGKDIVTVRAKENGKFIFVKSADSIQFSITIYDDGKIAGTIGTATLQNCYVKKNRNWFEEKLNFATDFVIRGKLKGKIFENDPNELKNISIPFNVTNFETSGTLFQLEGFLNFGLYPMSDFNLTKSEK